MVCRYVAIKINTLGYLVIFRASVSKKCDAHINVCNIKIVHLFEDYLRPVL